MVPLDAGVDRHHCQHGDGAGVIRRRHIRKRSSYLLDTVIVLVGLFCLLKLLRIVLTLHLRVPLDPNEGWNAYFAEATQVGGPLYPDPNTYLVNNYPPLSFYLVGSVGRLFGDNILAGRIISTLAFLSLAGAIWLAARRMDCGIRAASFAALLLSAYLLALTDYVGMNDPQLLGHALSTVGMIFLLGEPRSERGIFWAALLLSLAFFTKHNLIALPLALVLWLEFYDPRSALRLALWGAIFLTVGLFGFRLSYASDLLMQLHTARVYSFEHLANGISQWLAWAFVPLLATALLVWSKRHDKYAVLCGMYVATSFLLGAIFMSGAGVDLNALFDADMGLALAAGQVAEHWQNKGLMQLTGTLAAYVIPLIFGLWQASGGEWLNVRYWFKPLANEAHIAARDVAFLGARKGPVLCEEQALCYWAGKRSEVDVFNLGQQFATQDRNDGELVGLLKKRHYAALQFYSLKLKDFSLTRRVREAVLRSYRIDHVDDQGTFLLPLVKQGSSGKMRMMGKP